MSSPMPCGQAPCAEHGTFCAFHGIEEDRCRRCHRQWSVIASRNYHSCETGIFSAATRQEIEQERTVASLVLDQMTETAFCSHLPRVESLT